MFGRNIQSHYPSRYMEAGDRIFIRVSRSGVTLREFIVSNASNFTDLIGEIRYEGRDLVGLAQVFIRNYSRGWSVERPMKFYSASRVPKQRPALRAMRMLSPWETH